MKNKLSIVSLLVMLCFLITASPAGMAAEPQSPPDNSQDKIIAEFTEVIAKNPNDAVAHYFRSRAYSAKNQFDLAIKDLSKAIEINPKYAAAYLSRGYVYSRLVEEGKASDQAIDDYTQAIKLDRTYAAAYVNRAIQYNRKKQYDLAIEDTTKAIEFNPKHSNAYFVKAFSYEMKRQYEDAITTLRAFIAISQDQAGIEQAKSIIRSLGGTF